MNAKDMKMLIVKLQQLNANLSTTTDQEIEELVTLVEVNDFLQYRQSFQLRLYRARYNDSFDDSDPNQFSYIHNFNNIRVLRYNREHEAVLYTSTDPFIAFREIEQEDKPNTFYLSIWKPQNSYEISCCYLYDKDNCSQKSNAWKLMRALENVITNSVSRKFMNLIGQLMEREGTDYRFSSKMASKILQNYDAIASISAKSDGKEVNVTFNRQATDEKVKLLYVLKCAVPNNKTLVFQVEKFGVVENNRIQWYRLDLDKDSLTTNIPNRFIQLLIEGKLSPVAIDKIDNGRLKMLVSYSSNFSYEYRLLPINKDNERVK